jgi:NADH-quinone oxidoreductase subunit H
MIWFRWTFPRFREDQLQSLAWKVLVPLALANIAITAVFKVVLG